MAQFWPMEHEEKFTSNQAGTSGERVGSFYVLDSGVTEWDTWSCCCQFTGIRKLASNPRMAELEDGKNTHLW